MKRAFLLLGSENSEAAHHPYTRENFCMNKKEKKN